MAIIAKERLHLQPVAKGISLARKIDFPDARDTFGSRMFTPVEIDKFAMGHPWRFKLIMRKTSILSSAVCLASDSPLRSLIKDGVLLAESSYRRQACGGELHRISIPAASLANAGIDLDVPNPFLIINGGYILSKSDGNAFTLTIDPAYAGTLRQHVSLFSHNGKKPFSDWYENIGGVPVPSGKASPIRAKGTLFCFERDDSNGAQDPSLPLGSVRIGRIRRGAGLCDGGTVSVSILGNYIGAGAVLVKDESATAFAAFKVTLAQTWIYLKEISRGEVGKA